MQRLYECKPPIQIKKKVQWAFGIQGGSVPEPTHLANSTVDWQVVPAYQECLSEAYKKLSEVWRGCL